MARIAPIAPEPATLTAADGETTLTGFVVAAIIYAPTRREARRRLEHSIELDVGEITGRVPKDNARAAVVRAPTAADLDGAAAMGRPS